MSNLLRRTGRRYLQRHPWQLVLAVGGVAAGVAVTVSVALATASAGRAFRLTNTALVGSATHQVVGGDAGVPEGFYRQLRVDLGVAVAAPVLEGFVGLASDPSHALRLVGVDPLAEGEVRAGRFTRRPSASAFPLGRLLLEPGSVLALAGDPALRPGPLPVLVGDRTVDLDIVAALPDNDSGLRDVLFADIATAQEVLGRRGRLSRIDVRLDAATEVADLARIRAVLPAGTRVVGAQARADSTVQMTRAFELNLRAMSLLAMLCGLFLIYNTMTFSVVQRREQFGALRALGVTRAEILRLVLEEAAWIGAAGTAVGLAGGIALGHSLVRLVTRTVNDLYFVVAVRDLALPAWALAGGIGLGLGGTLLAALLPAREATRVSARRALTRSVLEERAWRAAPALAAMGACGALGGLVLARWPAGGLSGAFGGLLLIVLGASFLAPLAVRGVSRLGAAVLGRLAGVPGLVAARSLTAGLSRTSVAVAALALAVAVIVGVGVMVTSFRTTLVNWLDYTLQADLYVTSASARGTAAGLTVSEAQRRALDQLPGVARVGTIRGRLLETAAGPTRLLAVSFEAPDRRAYRLLDGDPAAAWPAVAAGAVMVSEPFAARRRVAAGDAILLPTPEGERSFDVAGVYASYASDRGAVLIARSTYDRLWDDPGIDGFSVYLSSPEDLDAVVEATRAALRPARVSVVSNRQLRERSLRVFDRTFLITGVLRLLVAMVAFAGVLGAILALQLESVREHGVLRVNGFTPAQLGQSVAWQSALLGVAAGGLALPLGGVLAWVMVHIINKRSFGWTLQMSVPPGVLWEAFGVAMVAALLAGLYPALRLARTPPAVILRED